MIPGKLNKIITIQSSTEALDAYGGTLKTWATFARAWAAVIPLRSRDLLAAQAALNETVVRFNIRYVAGVTAGMRILYDSKYYDITAVINVDSGNKMLDIMTKVGVVV